MSLIKKDKIVLIEKKEEFQVFVCDCCGKEDSCKQPKTVYVVEDVSIPYGWCHVELFAREHIDVCDTCSEAYTISEIKEMVKSAKEGLQE